MLQQPAAGWMMDGINEQREVVADKGHLDGSLKTGGDSNFPSQIPSTVDSRMLTMLTPKYLHTVD